jgi:methionine synthase II (cobalamin-independent)
MNQETSPTIAKASRVDQVGSLLRPQALKDAYAHHGNGEIGDTELSRVQDATASELIAKQEWVSIATRLLAGTKISKVIYIKT